MTAHSGAISRAVFGGDRFILGTAVNMGRFSGDLEQTLLVTGAHLVGVATISFALSGDADQPDKSRTVALRSTSGLHGQVADRAVPL